MQAIDYLKRHNPSLTFFHQSLEVLNEKIAKTFDPFHPHESMFGQIIDRISTIAKNIFLYPFIGIGFLVEKGLQLYRSTTHQKLVVFTGEKAPEGAPHNSLVGLNTDLQRHIFYYAAFPNVSTLADLLLVSRYFNHVILKFSMPDYLNFTNAPLISLGFKRALYNNYLDLHGKQITCLNLSNFRIQFRPRRTATPLEREEYLKKLGLTDILPKTDNSAQEPAVVSPPVQATLWTNLAGFRDSATIIELVSCCPNLTHLILPSVENSSSPTDLGKELFTSGLLNPKRMEYLSIAACDIDFKSPND